MAECECLPTCPFFNDKMANKPGTADMFKKKFCLGDNTNCARYIVMKKLGKPNVPPDLYPNQKKMAEQLIAVN
ncbi:uncharacterized protein Dvar_73560 [Desulfosarcina variabilis str. Montpellier]|uniref:hypothetical protein n=1 Tax=Desulfosarcina variabilis TaxID=2300 RepID=UPI003AFB6A14